MMQLGDMVRPDRYGEEPPDEPAQRLMSNIDPMTGMPIDQTAQDYSRIGAAIQHLVPRQYGEAFAGRGEPQPEIPGQITEGDVFRSDMQARQNALGGAQQAVTMLGLGGPAAITGGVPRGAFGMAGGRGKGPPIEAFERPQTGPLAETKPTLFDYSRIGEVPDVPQFALDRYAPPRGVSDRVADLVKNKKVEQQMLERIEAGKQIGPGSEKFYMTEPARDAFVAELGKKEGPEAFQRYMDYVAASSTRSDVPMNVRNASHYYVLDRQGQPMPEVGTRNPQPYGHFAQRAHQRQAAQVAEEGGWDVMRNPKPASFVQNLTGNLEPVTVDAHAFKLPAMLSRDPRFLAGSFNPEKGVTVNPSKMFREGDLTVAEALKEPTYWGSKPNANEYGAMEQYYQRLAKEAGLPAPAMAQAAAWSGGGQMTGLGSVAGEPFIRSLENRVNITAQKRGVSPQEALSRFIRGKEPLLAVPPAAALGTLVAPDRYGQQQE